MIGIALALAFTAQAQTTERYLDVSLEITQPGGDFHGGFPKERLVPRAAENLTALEAYFRQIETNDKFAITACSYLEKMAGLTIGPKTIIRVKEDGSREAWSAYEGVKLTLTAQTDGADRLICGYAYGARVAEVVEYAAFYNLTKTPDGRPVYDGLVASGDVVYRFAGESADLIWGFKTAGEIFDKASTSVLPYRQGLIYGVTAKGDYIETLVAASYSPKVASLSGVVETQLDVFERAQFETLRRPAGREAYSGDAFYTRDLLSVASLTASVTSVFGLQPIELTGRDGRRIQIVIYQNAAVIPADRVAFREGEAFLGWWEDMDREATVFHMPLSELFHGREVITTLHGNREGQIVAGRVDLRAIAPDDTCAFPKVDGFVASRAEVDKLGERLALIGIPTVASKYFGVTDLVGGRMHELVGFVPDEVVGNALPDFTSYTTVQGCVNDLVSTEDDLDDIAWLYTACEAIIASTHPKI